MKNSEKVDIIEFQLPMLKEQLQKAIDSLKQAQEDWCILNSCDGDRSLVKKNPIFSAVEAQVECEIAIGFLSDIERVLKA